MLTTGFWSPVTTITDVSDGNGGSSYRVVTNTPHPKHFSLAKSTNVESSGGVVGSQYRGGLAHKSWSSLSISCSSSDAIAGLCCKGNEALGITSSKAL
jgi:hypothetical protein